jgi:sugar (glycoside-pentoside-hexuronide) transporter
MSESEQRYLTSKDKFSFAASGFGQNMIIGLVNSFMLYFYTDVFLLPLTMVMVLMGVSRIWDIAITPIAGNIIDKTRTRYGKLKPYLIATVLPLAIITILLFSSQYFFPNNEDNTTIVLKLIYAYVTYLAFSVIYTFSDVPFWGLASAMTPNPQERTEFISFSRTFHYIGNGLPVLLVLVFLKLTGDNLKLGYLISGLFVGIVGAGLFILSITGTKERCAVDEKKPTLKENINYFLINKPLQSVFVANVLGFGQGLSTLASMYIATYLLGNADFNPLVVAATGVSGYVGMILTPKLLKKFNYRTLYQLCAVMGITAFIIMFMLKTFTGGYNAFIILGCLFISGFPLGIVGNINYAMIADSIDYVEWKTGKRTEGIAISFQSLMIKLIAAFQVTFVSIMLGLVSFVQPKNIGEVITIQEQSAATLNGMFNYIVFTPIIGWVIAAAVMSTYKFTGDQRKRAQEEINAARALKGLSSETVDKIK